MVAAWIKNAVQAAVPFLSSFFGGAASSAIGFASNVVSTKQQMKYQKELMKIQNKYNKGTLHDNYNYSKKLQQFQNNFTSGLAATAHQVEVNDLRKAGLNPILSVTGGSGATVPGASNASVSEPGVSGASAPDVDFLGSALAYRQQQNLNRQQKNLNRQTDANIENTHEDTWLKGKTASLIGEQARNEAERFDSIVQDRENSKAVTAAQVDYWKKQGDAAIRNAAINEIVGTSQAWRNYHQALGYSSSSSRSYSGKLHPGSFKVGTHKVNLGIDGFDIGGSYSQTDSRSW